MSLAENNMDNGANKSNLPFNKRVKYVLEIVTFLTLTLIGFLIAGFKGILGIFIASFSLCLIFEYYPEFLLCILRRAIPEVPNLPVNILPNDDFELTSDDSDDWLERRIIYNDKLIRITLYWDDIEDCPYLSYANTLIENFPSFFRNFEEFMQEEKITFAKGRFKEEIASLNVSSIDFFNTQYPDMAEIVLKKEDVSERIWVCSFRNGSFSELDISG